MSSSGSYIINDHKFVAVFGGRPYYPDGIIVTPEMDLDNPAVISGLKQIQKDWAYLNALQYLGEYQSDDHQHSQYSIEQANIALNPPDTAPEMSDRERIIANHIINGTWFPAKPRETKPAYTSKPGFVYLLKSSEGYYKIGRTKDPKNRMKTFGIQLPMHVEYVCLIETEDMSELETMLHIEYRSKRINGEWFDLSPDDVEYIKGLANV